MPEWKRLERRGGQRADQHVVTVAAYAHSNPNRPPQVNMLVGAQIVRELDWKPGPLDIEVDTARLLMRLRPAKDGGSTTASRKKDAETFTFCLPVAGRVEPHPTVSCEPWVVGDWLVLQIPAWLVEGMRDEPRKPLRRLSSEVEIPAGPQGAGDDGPPAPKAPKVEQQPASAPSAARNRAVPDGGPTAAPEGVAGPSGATPPAPATKPPSARPAPAVPAPAPKQEAQPTANAAPKGHHPERAVVLRKLWPLVTVKTSTLREKVNATVSDVPKFETNAALEAYAAWLGLGKQGSPETPKPSPAMAEAQAVPPEHSAVREQALRTAWKMAHLPWENIRQIVNQKSPHLKRFDLKGLQAYANWLGLGERPAAPPPQAKPASIAVRSEISAKSKERTEAEEEFAAGKSVREVADDFGLGIGTVSMWHYEWQQAQTRAAGAP